MTSPERELREKVQRVAALAKATSDAAKVSRETIASQQTQPVELVREVFDNGGGGSSNTP